MSDIVTFGQDLFISYLNLSFTSKVIIGGVISVVGLKLVGGSLGLSFLNILKPLRRKQKLKKYELNRPGEIYLHMFPRGIALHTPNMSPYAIKLETWLRLKKIQYHVVETVQFSNSTKQIPYVMYNDKEYTDSNLIMEFLLQEKNLDASEGLDTENKAVARSLSVMMDESFSWSYFMYRYAYRFKEFIRTIWKLSAPWPISKMIEKSFTKRFLERANAHGIGRKDQESVIHIGYSDIKAASDFLGDKQFMMGDSITTVDCCMFGHLSQVVYVNFHFPHKSYIQNNCQNLLPYLDWIKAKLWPDWNSIVKMSHN